MNRSKTAEVVAVPPPLSGMGGDVEIKSRNDFMIASA